MSLFLILLSGCSLNRPSDVMSPKEMEKFLYDYHLASAVVATLPKDQKFKSQALTDWAYQKNGITKEQLDRSLVWYTRYPSEFAKIYKKLNRRIETEYDESKNLISRIEKRSFSIGEGDSVSLWYHDGVVLLNSSRYMSKVVMEQSCGSSFKPCDTIVWKGNITIISPDSAADSKIYLAMTLAYADSVSTADTLLQSPSSCPLSFVMTLDTAATLQSVGFMAQFMENSTSDTRGMAVISDVSMMRFHSRTDMASLPADTVSSSL